MKSCLIYEITAAANRKAAREKWRELEDVSVIVDASGETVLDAPWEHFPAGTPVEDVWHWLEDTFHISVAVDLMGL